MVKRSKSSQRWLERQKRDPYVKKAAAAGLVSRAHFKLDQLDRRFGLLRPHAAVLELGAAPGGWTHYLARRVRDGFIVAVDVRPMPVPKGVVFCCMDIHSTEFEQTLADLIGARRLDLVLSDMAPNISGVKVVDQTATMALVDLATLTARTWLKPGGALVVKMFQGEGVDQWTKDTRADFDNVVLAKPDASRSQSREVYGVATGFTGPARREDAPMAGAADV